MINWIQFSHDVKVAGRITRFKHLSETLELASKSTLAAIWQGKPIGLIPYLRVCKEFKLNPLTYYED